MHIYIYMYVYTKEPQRNSTRKYCWALGYSITISRNYSEYCHEVLKLYMGSSLNQEPFSRSPNQYGTLIERTRNGAII